MQPYEPPHAEPSPRRLDPLLRPLALGIAFAFTFGAAAAAPRHASPLALDRLWADPRLLVPTALDPLGKAALADEYGLEMLLPADPRSTTSVANCNDSGAGSLRQAVLDTASGGTVDLRGLSCSKITLTTGQIEISQASLILIGDGRDVLTIANGNGTKYSNRIFNHTGTGTLIVEGMTVTGGVAAAPATGTSGNAFGGCIRSGGTVFLGNALFPTARAYGVDVTNCRAIAVHSGGYDGYAEGGGVAAPQVVITHSRVSGCSLAGPAGSGAGIAASDRLAMLNSEVSGNTNPLGGKYSSGGATGGYGETYDLILNSTISGNAGSNGGGLASRREMVIRNSTISGNTASVSGGGIYSRGLGGVHLSVFNSTITANRVTGDAGGGGLLATLDGFSAGTARLESTIIQGNFRGQAIPDDVNGSTAVFSGANNLVGVAVPQSPALPPDTLIGIDPHLGPLTDNGGPTHTHRLRSDSQAIGLGNNVAGDDLDQRGPGFARVIGTRADIGAVEFDPDRIFSNGFD